MAIHRELDGAEVDNVGWIQPTEPMGSSVVAGRCWVDTSSIPYVMKIRNTANTNWVTVGITTDAFSTDGNVYVRWYKEGSDIVEKVSLDEINWYEARRITLPS